MHSFEAYERLIKLSVLIALAVLFIVAALSLLAGCGHDTLIVETRQARLDCSDLPAKISGAGQGGIWTVKYPRRECEAENKRRGY